MAKIQHLLLFGATGMVGRSTLRAALGDAEVEHVTAVVRRPIDITHPKLSAVVHDDFLNYTALTDSFKEVDLCIWALGISQTKVKSEAEYDRITYQFTIAAANELHRTNPSATFIFVSGMGADLTEKSRTLFARVKGKTENALQRIGFPKLYIVRPAGIEPGPEGNPNGPFFERLLYPFYPLLRRIAPSVVISAPTLALAMLNIAKHGSNEPTISNTQLVALGSAA